METPITPLLVSNKPEPGGLFHNKEVAEITGISGNIFRDLQRDGLVMVRDTYRSGQTAWNLCHRSDIAVSLPLVELRKTINADFRVLQAASRALYHWCVPEQEARNLHPVTWAMYAAANNGGMWGLRLRFLKNDQTGQRLSQGFCYDMDDAPRLRHDPKDPWLEVCSLTLNLTPLMLPLVRAFQNYSKRSVRIGL